MVKEVMESKGEEKRDGLISLALPKRHVLISERMETSRNLASVSLLLVLSQLIVPTISYIPTSCRWPGRLNVMQRAVSLRCTGDGGSRDEETESLRQYRNIESWYEARISKDPISAEDLANYAIYLQVVRGKAERAALMYEMALRVDPILSRKVALDQWIRNVSAADLVSISLAKMSSPLIPRLALAKVMVPRIRVRRIMLPKRRY
ncbi:hypothetical protein GUITHDRAFT_111201 [Guillardia theta CCMP2712]|uniref:Uncharacterized protein n=1 Tax=Guillardia theta (strain CCMP2712) TaxID=905079 RepID=L1J3G3_GUITC|nr:hypothetical protein GUITHDRAFT_111201 [Guillardia theta CCMP2712]EKX42832.1 hypothetical protein GUITHDRAFT_111201 [Guillardia theta CCMP2712]|eukprot:XP_005829812.1 hypothetical protein GUITHDRAFT_111201 [Guillardia theta CCMP2712]